MVISRVTTAIAVAALLCAGTAAEKSDAASASRSGGNRQGNIKSPAVRVLARIASAADVAGKRAATSSSKQLRLLKPHGVAVDPAGRVFVADPVQHVIMVFDRRARTATAWTGSAAHPLAGPAGLAFRSDNSLFVTDAYQGRVVVFDSAGNAVASFGKDLLKRPAGIVVDASRHRIYVADTGLRKIVTFDDRTFAFTGAFGSAQAVAPSNLALNSSGLLYVMYPAECLVRGYEPDGRVARSFETTCVQRGHLARPGSIAIDREDRIYVAAAELGSLQVFTPDGGNVLFTGSLGKRSGTPVVRTAIALDREGRIYVAEQEAAGGSICIFERISEQSRQLRARGMEQARR
jgi:DNA-binding beta-propeller fold protein YncE